jgi:hypothetical protein
VLIRSEITGVSGTHGPSFAGACLTISQDRGIEPRKASQHQVSDTSVEYLLLAAILAVTGIKSEHFFCANGDGISLGKSSNNLFFEHLSID